jgi:hypothetical protein
MSLRIGFLLLISSTLLLAQPDLFKSVVAKNTVSADLRMPDRLETVFPRGERPDADTAAKLKFYSVISRFALRGKDGLVIPFSFTDVPKKGWSVSIEADKNVYGAILFGKRLYVCSLLSTESSLPVINRFLASIGPRPLSKDEARSIATAVASCSGAVYIYGGGSTLPDDVRKQMEQVASAPEAVNHQADISVFLYSWSVVPAPAVIKWSILFRGRQVVGLKREAVSMPARQENGPPSSSGKRTAPQE